MINISAMKRSLVLIMLLSVMTLNATAQFVGNPQWKWDTIVLYGLQDVLAARYMQACDENGNIQEQLIQERESSSWVNQTRITMGYADGRIISSTTAVWSAGAWYDVARITPTYDILGRIIAELIEQNKINGWINHRLRHYAYGVQNRKMQMIQEKWSNGAWQNDSKSDYGYDNNGNYDTVTLQFSEDGESWVNGMRLIYTCDQWGNWLKALLESWDTGEWIGGQKINYTSDTRGNILTETYAGLTGNTWVDEFRRVYTYDAYDNAISGKNEIFSGMQWIPEVTSSYIYYKKDYLVMLQDNHYRFEASYGNFPFGIGEKPIRLLTIYPNPANDSFRIGSLPSETFTLPGTGLASWIGSPSDMLTEISLYNEAGSLVRNIQVGSISTINVADLNNGLYIIKATSGKAIYTGKLLIHHP